MVHDQWSEIIDRRGQKISPKQGVFWCRKCDAQLVVEGKKCKKCGHKNGKRYHKKHK